MVLSKFEIDEIERIFNNHASTSRGHLDAWHQDIVRKLRENWTLEMAELRASTT